MALTQLDEGNPEHKPVSETPEPRPGMLRRAVHGTRAVIRPVDRVHTLTRLFMFLIVIQVVVQAGNSQGWWEMDLQALMLPFFTAQIFAGLMVLLNPATADRNGNGANPKANTNLPTPR